MKKIIYFIGGESIYLKTKNYFEKTTKTYSLVYHNFLLKPALRLLGIIFCVSLIMTLVVFAMFETKNAPNLLRPLLHHLTFLSGFAATTTDRTTHPRPRTPWRRLERSRTPSPPVVLTRYNLYKKLQVYLV